MIVLTGTNLLTAVPCSLLFSQKKLHVLIIHGDFCSLLLFIKRSHKSFRHDPVPMNSDLHLAKAVRYMTDCFCHNSKKKSFDVFCKQLESIIPLVTLEYCRYPVTGSITLVIPSS